MSTTSTPDHTHSHELSPCLISSATHHWLPKFQDLTLPTHIIPINQLFCDYLLAKGTVILPKPTTALVPTDPRSYLADASSLSSNSSSTSYESEHTSSSTSHSSTGTCHDVAGDIATQHAQDHGFPEIERSIADAIQLWDSIFIKLTWSAPQVCVSVLPGICSPCLPAASPPPPSPPRTQDAAWSTGSLKVDNPGAAFMLLKSSDRASFDLKYACVITTCENQVSPLSDATALSCHAIPRIPLTHRLGPGSSSTASDTRVQHHLVLKPWTAIHPAEEWRVVLDDSVLAISQRHQHVQGPADETTAAEIGAQVLEFVEAHVIPRGQPCQPCVVDIWAPAGQPPRVIDFAPCGAASRLSCFPTQEDDWACASASELPPHVAQVEVHSAARPSTAVPVRWYTEARVQPADFLQHALPADLAELQNPDTLDAAIRALRAANA